ncbi:MAG: hypothetical protein AAFX39_05160 [Pseudomonadota bacterium]
MSSISASYAASSAAQTQAALGTEMVKMQAQAAQGLAELLEESAQALQEAVATPAPGQGIQLDTSA